jgi:hypothetical protein
METALGVLLIAMARMVIPFSLLVLIGTWIEKRQSTIS